MGTMNWQPSWWNETHTTGWERVKEAMHRDWEQTKRDMHVKGAHELNQGANDTVKQATGKEAIPPAGEANAPKASEWNDVELPHQYGHAARAKYGEQHTAWSTELEKTLKGEWDAGRAETRKGWDDVKSYVRRGYEHGR